MLEGEGIVIKEAQKESFPEEYHALTSEKPISKSRSLSSIIRCDGRLQYTEFLPFDTGTLGHDTVDTGSRSLLLNITMSLEITWLEPTTH